MKNKLQKLCDKITHHKFCRGIFYNNSKISPIEYYYKCWLCGKVFKSTKPYPKAKKQIEKELEGMSKRRRN